MSTGTKTTDASEKAAREARNAAAKKNVRRK